MLDGSFPRRHSKWNWTEVTKDFLAITVAIITDNFCDTIFFIFSVNCFHSISVIVHHFIYGKPHMKLHFLNSRMCRSFRFSAVSLITTDFFFDKTEFFRDDVECKI